MRHRTLLPLSLGILTSLFISGCQNANREPLSSLALDDRVWTPMQKNVYVSKAQPAAPCEKDFTIDLIPSGQNASNWQEMVTVQHFRSMGKEITPRSFEKMFLAKITAPKGNIGHYVVSENKDALVFVWQAVQDPKLHDQQGLVRVATNAEGVDVRHYTAKASIPEEKQRLWAQLFSKSQLDDLRI